MAALSHCGTLFVMTHDSIGLGEDGPTHQPVEHLASFRCMPNILMMRPGDGNETAGAYLVRLRMLPHPTLPGLCSQNADRPKMIRNQLQCRSNAVRAMMTRPRPYNAGRRVDALHSHCRNSKFDMRCTSWEF